LEQIAKVENSNATMRGLIEENNEIFLTKLKNKLGLTWKIIKFRDFIELLIGIIDLIKGLIESKIKFET
jgi:hypothetical protein